MQLKESTKGFINNLIKNQLINNEVKNNILTILAIALFVIYNLLFIIN